MAPFTGEVEYTPGGPTRFRVVFKMVNEVVSEQPVRTQEEGEELIIKTLQGLQDIAKRDGYV